MAVSSQGSYGSLNYVHNAITINILSISVISQAVLLEYNTTVSELYSWVCSQEATRLSILLCSNIIRHNCLIIYAAKLCKRIHISFSTERRLCSDDSYCRTSVWCSAWVSKSWCRSYSSEWGQTQLLHGDCTAPCIFQLSIVGGSDSSYDLS